MQMLAHVFQSCVGVCVCVFEAVTAHATELLYTYVLHTPNAGQTLYRYSLHMHGILIQAILYTLSVYTVPDSTDVLHDII